MAKSEKSIIKKIELNLGGKTVSLTTEQAKALKEALDGLFGEKVIEYYPITYPAPYPPPYPPWYWHYSEPQWTYNPTGTNIECVANYSSSGILSLNVG